MKPLPRTLPIVAFAFALAACGGGSQDEGSADPGNDVAGDAVDVTTPSAEAPETGTRENPVPIDTPVQIGEEWLVQVGATNLDATDIVLQEYEYNEISEGMVPILAPVTATYVGGDQGDIGPAFDFAFVSAGGNTYNPDDDTSYDCGAIPDSVSDVGSLYPDASGTGNICIQVPTEDVAGGTWRIEENPWVVQDGAELFFALQ